MMNDDNYLKLLCQLQYNGNLTKVAIHSCNQIWLYSCFVPVIVAMHLHRIMLSATSNQSTDNHYYLRKRKYLNKKYNILPSFYS